MRIPLEIGGSFEGREILYIENFPGAINEWKGYKDAQERLRDLGYWDGSMQRSNPIGFYPTGPDGRPMAIPKWSNMGQDQRAQLHGVMIAIDGDWRHGTVQLVWFEYPVQSPLGHIPFERLTKSEKS